MSSLTAAEKLYLEKILGMSTGWVLQFNNIAFGEIFNRHGVDIHSLKYQKVGESKAKKLRSFWEQEPDDLVGTILSELLDSYEADCRISGKDIDATTLPKSRAIVARLLGKPLDQDSISADKFLSLEFKIPSIEKLPIDFVYSEIIQSRVAEAQSCMKAGAYLSVVLLCGSVLEAVLLGAAQREPEKFNRSKASPKNGNKVKPFTEWKLSEFIDVAHNISLLKLDVQKFSHGLRDFRNYIHPYEQLASGFSPDEHTANVCFQVLKAALASAAGER